MPVIRYFLPAVLVCASPVSAGVVITLEATPPTIFPPVGYVGGEVARVDVYAQLDAGSPAMVRVRMAQFDLSDSNPELTITPALFEYSKDDMYSAFWNLRSASACAADPDSCGTNYYIDGSLEGQPPNILNLTYTGLTPSLSFQVLLRQSQPTLLGSLLVKMPEWGMGLYNLNVLNADESDINLRAEFRFGFGTPTDPSVTWTARDGTVTGGGISFIMGIPEPATLTLLLLGTAFLTTKTRSA